ncbi:hypothetical protein [Thiolapillus sp.]|uniref:hypothetical protein n=1 Tax=Thiolapillus sp. TaxID=2017437 RepID=UPI003AF4563E
MKFLIAVLLPLFWMGLSAASVTMEVGEKTGLRTWQWNHDGVSLRLVQRLPDQTRAYLQGRGFPAEIANELATSCFFGSIFRNDGSLPLDFDLTTWKVVHKGKKSQLLVREYWKQRLQDQVLPQAARIALNWSLMPTVQHFEPGDYNWGMTVYGLSPGESFDLHLKILLDGKPVEATLSGLQCAPEKLN